MGSDDSGGARRRQDTKALNARRAGAAPVHAGRAEIGARATAELDRRLFDALPVPAWIVDEATQRIHDVNAAAVARFGWTREEFAALSLRDLHAGGELPARSLLAGEAADGGWRARTKSGETLLVDVARGDAHWTGARAWLALVHERPAPGERIESERLFHDLAEHLDHVVWVGEVDGGRVLYINPACRRVFGWAEECFYADPQFYRKLAHPDDVRELEALLAALVKDGRGHAEYRIVRPDGVVRWMHTEAYVVRDEDGRPWRHSGFTRDITARRESQLETQRLQAELERRVEQRTAELVALNRELETFSYSVSHDLKEPVRAIEGLTAILMSDHAPQLSPEARGLVARLQTGAARMRSLIDGLLALSRVERKPLAIAEVDMNRLASEVVNGSVHETGRRAVKLSIGELPACRGDASLMRIVLVNLLSNALKFTRERERPVIEIGFEDGAYFVRDNGVGIEMRHAERVFAPFERLHAHDRYEGSGIGLATVRRIVERHHGRVWVESVPGAGATFRFTLSPRA